MRIVKSAEVKDLTPGTVLNFERGVEGKPGYGKMVFVLDSPGNPNYAKFSMTDRTVQDYLHNRWILTVED